MLGLDGREQRRLDGRGRRRIKDVVVLVAIHHAAVPGVVIVRHPGLGGRALLFLALLAVANRGADVVAVFLVPLFPIQPVGIDVAGADIDFLRERDDGDLDVVVVHGHGLSVWISALAAFLSSAILLLESIEPVLSSASASSSFLMPHTTCDVHVDVEILWPISLGERGRHLAGRRNVDLEARRFAWLKVGVTAMFANVGPVQQRLEDTRSPGC